MPIALEGHMPEEQENGDLHILYDEEEVWHLLSENEHPQSQQTTN